MNNEIQNNDVKVVDEMKPLKDFLLHRSTTAEFIEECRIISATENIDHEIVSPKLLNDGNK